MNIQNNMGDLDHDTRKTIIQKYQPDAKRLARYISWLETKHAGDVVNRYAGDGMEKPTFSFPVYDSTLMSFLKVAKETQFITRNYQYVYTRNRIKDTAQEKKLIKGATLREMDILSGILSRYVLGGMTKSVLWSQAVEEGIFLEILYKMREILSINEEIE